METIKQWDELEGKTINKILFHISFDDNGIALVFTDKTVAVLKAVVSNDNSITIELVTSGLK